MCAIDSLWPNEAIWRLRYGSIGAGNGFLPSGINPVSAQMLTCNNEVPWHSSEGIIRKVSVNTNQWHKIGNCTIKVASRSSRNPWVNRLHNFACDVLHYCWIGKMTSSNDKYFPCYWWPFVRGIHRSPVNSTHKGQWRGALMLSLICAWISRWVNNREAGDLSRQHAHYDVIVMGAKYNNMRSISRVQCAIDLYDGSVPVRWLATVFNKYKSFTTKPNW